MPISITKKIQPAAQRKIKALFSSHPFGDAAATGTAITSKKERAIKSKIAN